MERPDSFESENQEVPEPSLHIYYLVIARHQLCIPVPLVDHLFRALFLLSVTRKFCFSKICSAYKKYL